MNPRCPRCYGRPHYSVIVAPGVAVCNRCGKRFVVRTIAVGRQQQKVKA